MILGQVILTTRVLKSYHHRKRPPRPRNKKTQSWWESTGQWELRIEKRAGMSCELCIVRTVQARKGARWVGVLEEYGAPL
jgi:hypothetical protein